MQHNSPTPLRSSFGPGQIVKLEDIESGAAVTRPVPRRAAALPQPRSPAAETSSPLLPGCSAVPSSNLSNTPVQNGKSAWVRYVTPISSKSPPKQVSPPLANAAIVARHAEAQRLWETHAAANGDVVFSTTPQASDSPTDSSPQASPEHGSHRSQPENLSARAPCLRPFRAALSNQILNGHSAPSMAALNGCDMRGLFPSGHSNSGLLPASQGSLSVRPNAERSNIANGSLSILPEGSQQLMGSGGSGQCSFQTQAANLAFLQQKIEELQTQMVAQASTRLSSLPHEPMLYQSAASLPSNIPGPIFPAAARYDSQDFKDPTFLPSNLEVDALSKQLASQDPATRAAVAAAVRRWDSTSSLASEGSSFGPQGCTPPAQLAASLISQMPFQDPNSLMQSVQMLYQAKQMAALANSRIQAISMAASANIEAVAGSGMRKRKAAEYYEEAPKRHNSMVSEGDNYSYSSGQQQQVCAECGTQSTPTWRRSGKRLMCNACGLRRSRSIRSARSTPMPLTSLPVNHQAAERQLPL